VDLDLQTTDAGVLPTAIEPTNQRLPTQTIRDSLKASTLDGVYAAIFSNLTGGVLLSNFLVNLQASAFEIGIIAAIPMLANFVQPLGAWLSDRFDSRLRYCTGVYFPSRLVWLFLPLGIILYMQGILDARAISLWTIATVALSHLLGGLGSAAWLSWMAVLVPKKLRGRYFSIRNSAANLTSTIVAIGSGFWVASYPRGELEGFTIALVFGIGAGLVSLVYQWRMADVHPQGQIPPSTTEEPTPSAMATILADRQFQVFLAYFSGWMFALNLSAPFFNIYLLQDLGIDVGWVTLYNSLTSAANLLLLIPLGRLSDRIGNRLLSISIGLLLAVLPFFWLGTGTDPISLWVVFPLLFILNGGASGAIDLCNNNLQITIAHHQHQAKYFGITAAVAGVSGALGTTLGGGLARWDAIGGLMGLFVISGCLRLLSLVPLFWLELEGEASFLHLFDFLRSKRIDSL
jgi:MFS family permease